MKTLIVGILSLYSISVFAQCYHESEGQLMPTNVKKVILHESGCRVIPVSGHTQSNDFCPLDDSGIMSKGIEVGFNIKKECNFKEGDPISGIIFNTGKDGMGLELEGPKKYLPEECEPEIPELKGPKDLGKDWDKVKEKLEEVR